jgi:CHAT domain-containing protein/Flp pilus assembly protein TadD
LHAQTWHIYRDSAFFYQEEGKYTLAISNTNKAIELYKNTVSVLDTHYSALLKLQVANHYYAGLHKKGLEFAKTDSIWCEKNNHITGTVYTHLGMLYKYLGKYELAEKLYLVAMETDKTMYGTSHIEYASSCNNIGLLYKEIGKYTHAEPLLLTAQKIFEKQYGKKSREYATALNNLALLYQAQGKLDIAEEYFIQAIDTDKSIFGTQHPEYASGNNNLASLYMEKAEYAKAETLYKKALLIREKVLGKKHYSYINTCNSLALCYHIQKKYKDAEELYIHTKNARAELLGQNHPLYATTCHTLGGLYQDTGQLEKAESLLVEAKRIYEITLSKNHQNYSYLCAALGLLYSQKKQFILADTFFIQAISLKQKEIERNFITLTEAEKQTYLKANIYKTLYMFYEYAITRSTTNPSIACFMYNLVLNTKGMILNSTQKMKQRILTSGQPELIAMYENWQESKQKIGKFYQITLTQQKQSKLNIDSLNNVADQLEKQLAQKSQDFASIIQKPIVWQEVQKQLQNQQAAVEILKTEYQGSDSITYCAMIIKKDSKYPELVILKYGKMLEKELFINYKRSIRHKIDDPYSYNAYWKPLEPYLKDVHTIFLAADGVYNQISLSTLYDTRKQQYLLENTHIIQLTNTKDLLQKPFTSNKNNYVIANPAFEIDPKKLSEKHEKMRSFYTVENLSGAEKEGQMLASILPDVVLSTGKNATEKQVKSLLHKPYIIHFATHGYFYNDSRQNAVQAMLNAGLLLAGVIDYDKTEIPDINEEDGKITAYEIMNMSLDNTELVVLSACETGLGLNYRGEGVYGLQRAFKVAGANTLIMSLWKVNDEATQLLMSYFYQNWIQKKMEKSQAFKHAQKEVLKQYAHPYYWGAFVLVK